MNLAFFLLNGANFAKRGILVWASSQELRELAVRKGIQIALISLALALSSTATVFAVDTPTPTPTPTATLIPSPSPSPQSTAKAKPAKQILTQAQKDAIAAARLAFSNAKINAQNGFDRAIADAQAIRDQAIAAAGKDKNALSAAGKDYRTSYRAILNAYKADLKNAKSVFQAAIAALKLPHPPSS